MTPEDSFKYSLAVYHLALPDAKRVRYDADLTLHIAYLTALEDVTATGKTKDDAVDALETRVLEDKDVQQRIAQL